MSRVQSDEALKLGTVPIHRLFIVVESRRRCRLASRTLSLIKGIEACRHACVRAGWENVIRPCCFLLRFRRLRANKINFSRIQHPICVSIIYYPLLYAIFRYSLASMSFTTSSLVSLVPVFIGSIFVTTTTEFRCTAPATSCWQSSFRVENKSRRKARESERDCLFFVVVCFLFIFLDLTLPFSFPGRAVPQQFT